MKQKSSQKPNEMFKISMASIMAENGVPGHVGRCPAGLLLARDGHTSAKSLGPALGFNP